MIIHVLLIKVIKYLVEQTKPTSDFYNTWSCMPQKQLFSLWFMIALQKWEALKNYILILVLNEIN